MLGFDDHGHPERLEFFHDDIGDLVGEPLLDLEPARVDVYEASELGDADELMVRDVCDMGLAEKRQ